MKIFVENVSCYPKGNCSVFSTAVGHCSCESRSRSLILVLNVSEVVSISFIKEYADCCASPRVVRKILLVQNRSFLMTALHSSLTFCCRCPR